MKAYLANHLNQGMLRGLSKHSILQDEISAF